jgi:lipopolysaccharide/colanic/teichoic acid biosynthesis glycosyltransferase
MEAALSQGASLPSPTSNAAPAYEPPRRKRADAIDLEPSRHAPSGADLELVESRDEILPAQRSEAVSRALNIAIALAALIATLPLTVVVGILIRLTSPGPAFYSQIRVGLDRRHGRKRADDRRQCDHGGKPFIMYKFRTMRVDAEADGRAVWAKKEDPRVTPIGGLLRRTRIDELPQLYNVILGDMNIVGPRPERPSIFAELREEIPEYPIRQRVKPGITGWAQVNQSYDSCVDDVRRKVTYDLEYVRRQSMLEDLRIMSRTIPVILFRRGGW